MRLDAKTGDTVGAPVSEKRADDIGTTEKRLSSEPLEKEHMNYDRIDDELAQYASEVQVEIDEETDIRLRKLIDKRVLFIMIPTYFLQAIDKGTMSFASIMGILPDTGMLAANGKGPGPEFAWLTTCIYIAVLIVEYPTNRILQHVPIAKYLGVNIVLWGAILAIHAAGRNFTGLVILRTLLGIFEAVCQPSFILLSSMWYKRSEQTAVVIYWYMMNGAQQVVGGLLAYCFSLIPPTGPVKAWQALFIAYGTASVLWGFFVIWYMPDSPMRAKCFSEEDKRLMIERVRSNQTGLQNKKFRKEQAMEALKDPQMWCHCGIAICTTLPTSGLGAFSQIIIKSFNFNTLQTQLLAMPLGGVILLVLLGSTWLVKKYDQTLLVMLVFLIPSFIGTIILMTIQNTTKATQGGLLFSYYIVFSFWSAQTLSLAMISRNIGGQTKKSVVIAANFIAWCVGNAVGPQVFLSWDAPRYFIAFAVQLACYSVLALIIIYLRFHLIRQNKKKDALAAAGIHEAHDTKNIHAFEDLTDRENLNFRYAY